MLSYAGILRLTVVYGPARYRTPKTPTAATRQELPSASGAPGVIDGEPPCAQNTSFGTRQSGQLTVEPPIITAVNLKSI